MQSTGLDARRARLTAAQYAELERRLRGTSSDSQVPSIPVCSRSHRIPLSYAQKGLWMTWQLDPESPAYNMCGVLSLRGDLDTRALATALNALAERHEVLRTVYPTDVDGEPVQRILPSTMVPLRQVDLSGSLRDTSLDTARQQLYSFAEEPFKLNEEAPFRAVLYRLTEKDHLLGLSLHHIAGDGWSIGILIRELFSLYEAFGSNVTPRLPPLPCQFADYVIWQSGQFDSGERERQIEYWRAQLGSEHSAIDLPLRQPRRSTPDAREARHAFQLSSELSEKLRQLSRSHGASLYVVMVALLKLVLYRFSGQPDVRVGTPVANRQKAETHGLVGYLLNLVVLRTRIDPTRCFSDLMASVRETALEAQAHQDLPFDQLVEILAPERQAGVHPLFQVKCTQQDDVLKTRTMGGLTVDIEAVSNGRVHFDLSFDFTDRADGIECVFIYAGELFDRAVMSAIARTIDGFAEQVTRSPDVVIARLDLPVPRSELYGQKCAHGFTDVVRLWARVVERGPSKLAIQHEQRCLTYEQMDAQANRLARILREHGIGADIRVGLHAQRSCEFVIGMLAILKAGGAYVPLDPALPPERLDWQVRDSGAVLLLSVDTPAWDPGVPVLQLDLPRHLERAPAQLARPLNPSCAAYVIYTSGSTGRPKGVVVSHGALANYVQALLGPLSLFEEAISMAMVSTTAADLGHTVLFGALCFGHLLHLIDAERAFDPDGFADYMNAHRVDVLKIVPSHLQALLSAANPAQVLPRQLLIIGGEASSWALVDHIHTLHPKLRVVNHYGPTETTVGILTQEAVEADRTAETLPVGVPLANSAAYVLDAWLNLTPAGVAGELYLGGPGIARGYQSRAGHTAERFVASPFGGGDRLYRTGDRVRRLASGALEFLGRFDDQVKVRGYRVELREVIHALRAHPGVSEAEVIARSGDDGRQQLYAYVVADADVCLDMNDLRDALTRTLPDYMVPVAIMHLLSLPLTANGKVDRKALPLPSVKGVDADAAPQSSFEQALAEIWAEVLSIERVGRHDDFLAIGGDSILALKVVARARKRGLDFLPKHLFAGKTIAGLAEILETGSPADPRHTTIPILPKTDRLGPLPVSYAQARQWFLWQLDRESTAYHISGALRLKGELDVPALRSSFAALVARHESLRTVFRSGADGQAEQVIVEAGRAHIEEIDVSSVAWPEREERVRAQAVRLQQTPFDLEHGPLLRIGLICLSAEEHVLVVVLHHIVSDGWSMQILIDEWVRQYEASVRGEEAKLAPLPIQYADYAVWQRSWLEAGERDRQLAYWRSRLSDEHPLLQLPTDRPRPAQPSYRTLRHEFDLPALLVTSLHERARAHHATLFMILLAGFQMLLHRYTGQRDIRIGMTNSNRHHPETDGVVGFFVNTQVVRSEIDDRTLLAILLDQVRAVVGGAQEHQDLPFEQLVEALQPERDGRRQPLFQILMDHQRKNYGRLSELPGLTLEDYPLSGQGALFELWMNTVEHADGRVSVLLSYAAELFEPETIERLGRHYLTILQAIVDRPQQRLGEIELLGKDECLQLRQWGGDLRHYPSAEPLHRLIERQVDRSPAAIALTLGDIQISYGELNRRVNRLAHRLIALGVGPEVRIGLAMERSVELVVGLLAILKAGGAYVPLDPQYPADRLSYMMLDSGITWLLTGASVARCLPIVNGILALEIDALDLASEPEHDPHVPVHADNLAYVIYTSGSTGRPKGALLCHRNVTRLLEATHEWFRFDDRDVWTLFHSYAFDFSVWEIFGALCYGGRLVIVPYALSRSPEEFLTVLREQQVTVLNQTPSAFKHLMQVPALYEFDDLVLRVVIFGGEALDPQSLRRWIELFDDFEPRLVNMYGITETTVHVTYMPITRNDLQEAHSPIGTRIQDLGIRVLDIHLNPVPISMPGELYVAGAGLARGYLNRASLTSERFIADPFSATGERLYRTGDMVRWNAQGQLEYLGRIDTQVKIRGFRIELGEIEAQLLSQPEVSETVVVAQGEVGDKRLLAYLVPNASVLEARSADEDAPSPRVLVSQWESVFDNAYESEGRAPSFRGWSSSYTDQPIPEEQMQEWLQSTVERIRTLKPERVLEIGCGVGLLVQHLAPSADRYVGTDLSTRAVNDLQAWIRTQPALSHVQLRRTEAADFTGIHGNEFDTVVLNSVAQYLPEVDYLMEVIEGAARVVGPLGRLFIGDLRHLAHVSLFHASVQLAKASTRTTLHQLKSRIARVVAQDKELVLDPAFFHALGAHLGMHVEIQLKRGHFDNELTRYRYDVVLRGECAEVPAAELLDISDANVLERLEHLLANQRPPVVRLHAVANRRLARDLVAWDLMQSSDGRTTVGELLSQLQHMTLAGVDPEAVWSLGEVHGYDVRISWSEGRADGAFDAEITERSRLMRSNRTAPSAALPRHWRELASDPVRALFMQQLGPRLRDRLSRTLPDHMVPAHFVLLDRLPLNANGKLDRRALPDPEYADTGHYQPPQGEIEGVLAKIWAEVLGVERVGRHDNFFELGGHSLMAIRIVSHTRRAFDCEFSLRSVFEHPTLSEQAGVIQLLRKTSSATVLRASDLTIDRPPLSYAQQRLWFLWRLDPRSASMNSSTVLRLTGRLNLDAWRTAWQFLVARHAVLRTVFKEEDGQVWQQMLDDSVAPNLVIDDLSALEGDRESHLKQCITEEMRRPFDLEHGPLLRVQLFRLIDDAYVMCVVMHHIVTDGWSIDVIIRDFVAAYATGQRGNVPNLPPLSLRYVDFAVGQREWLERGEMQRQLDYWKGRLAGVAPLLLPPDKSQSSQRSYPCGVMRTSLGPDVLAQLQGFCEPLAATPFMVLLTAVCVAMAERSGQGEFLVGTDFANRTHPETESLVGFFVNQVALPINCAGHESARELLMQVRNTVIGAADHQDLPFDRLVESLRIGRRESGRAPLFQVKVLYQQEVTSSLALPELRIDDYPIHPAEVELDMILLFRADPERILLTVKYDLELFEPSTVECIGQEIMAVLQAMLTRSDIGLEALRAEASRCRHAFEARQAEERTRNLALRRAGLRPRSAISPR